MTSGSGRFDAITGHLAAFGAEGRCEGCSRPITAGELVYVIEDGGGDLVVVHAASCAGEQHRDG